MRVQKEAPDLAGKFVIIGVTAEGIANPVPTPRGNLYPQHIQAHMLQNFVDGFQDSSFHYRL